MRETELNEGYLCCGRAIIPALAITLIAAAPEGAVNVFFGNTPGPTSTLQTLTTEARVPPTVVAPARYEFTPEEWQQATCVPTLTEALTWQKNLISRQPERAGGAGGHRT